MYHCLPQRRCGVHPTVVQASALAWFAGTIAVLTALAGQAQRWRSPRCGDRVPLNGGGYTVPPLASREGRRWI
eukprot:4450984-Pleurochrysis_carterae.AAC.2